MGDSTALQKVYGRGFFDGQRKAMEQMNNAKINAIENSVSGIARKVLEAIPISEEWTAAQIAWEVKRNGGSGDQRIIGGCINSLIQSGVVREPTRGNFIRVGQKPKLATVPPQEKEEKGCSAVLPVVEVKATQADPMKKIIEIAASMRESAANASRLAVEIEEVALDMESRIEKIHADTNKLRQLQELLKSINQ